MTGQPSFRRVSDDNHASLVEYIGRLRAAGLKFPARGGVVNKTAIAPACGFAREAVQQNPRFSATFNAAVAEIGIKVSEIVAEPAARNGEDKARILSRRFLSMWRFASRMKIQSATAEMGGFTTVGFRQRTTE